MIFYVSIVPLNMNTLNILSPPEIEFGYLVVSLFKNVVVIITQNVVTKLEIFITHFFTYKNELGFSFYQSFSWSIYFIIFLDRFYLHFYYILFHLISDNSKLRIAPECRIYPELSATLPETEHNRFRDVRSFPAVKFHVKCTSLLQLLMQRGRWSLFIPL